MRLSLILKFTFLALPTVLLNNTLGYKYSTPAPIDAGPVLGDSLHGLVKVIGATFNEQFGIVNLNKQMYGYANNNFETIIEEVCKLFQGSEQCINDVTEYIERCKRGRCLQLERNELFTSSKIKIEVMNNYQLVTTFYIFRHCGIYERSYFKRKFKKLFKREGRGYSSYAALVNALLNVGKGIYTNKSLSESLINFYVSAITLEYATIIYRDSKLAKVATIIGPLGTFIFRFKKHFRSLVKDMLGLAPVPFCDVSFDLVIQPFTEYLENFNKPYSSLASKIANSAFTVLNEEISKTGFCYISKGTHDSLNFNGIVQSAGNALRNAGATISKRTTGALRGIHRRLTEASDKIRNRFRSRNGNGDDGSSDGLLDEDATGEATNDVKPEDDSTGDNEPKEDEITRL
ncbi:Rhoptry-associated protein 1 [Babesia duncani]|uniref:Rhoptry-associated protein 1 n=1 Tax=Babesia duncani TaxID=323732 RepID=A0AAD9PIZ2_9APIC|nr:Rhoptry-associated protein 1 [Babesia duncani]